MLRDIIFTLWFFLPVGIANMMPIFAAHWPYINRYNQPIDFGKTWRGQRIFGSHKTWRGIIVGIICATLTLWLQQLLYNHLTFIQWIAHDVNYSVLPVLIVGPLFGIGALLGDALESFFKRQHGIAPGDGWFPWDQTDYIIGGALFTAPYIRLSLWQYGWLLLIWLCVHIVASFIGYKIGLKDKPI